MSALENLRAQRQELLNQLTEARRGLHPWQTTDEVEALRKALPLFDREIDKAEQIKWQQQKYVENRMFIMSEQAKNEERRERGEEELPITVPASFYPA